MNKLLHCAGAVTLLFLTACSTTGFNLPPLVASADGGRLPGKIIWHDLLTDTPQETREFYSGLFGWQFEPLPGGINYVLIRHRGELIGGMVDQNRLPTKADISQWVVVMSVADIEAATGALREAGGTVYTPPTSLGDRGTIAVVADAEGALLALLETVEGDPPDLQEVPDTGSFLWDELWADDVEQSSRFYRGIAPFSQDQLLLDGPGGQIDYRVLKSAGRARMGIRPNPTEDMSPLWVSYLRVADEAGLQAVLARVNSLGGQVLVPATQRPGGGSLAVIAGPSGAGIALQTWTGDSLPGR